MTRKEKYLPLLLAPLLAAGLLLLLFALKGIAPFGEGNLLGGDLYQLYFPNLIRAYRAWHGGSLFYDFSVAGGYASNELMQLLRPTNWLFLLLPPERITETASWTVLLKLSLVALGGAYGFRRLFPALTWQGVTALALLYTFSGYNMLYYTNLGWLDAVALYPVLLAALMRMFRGGSKLPYALVLTCLLCLQSYMAYFQVMSLLVFGGLYLFLIVDKETRRQNIYALGAGTLAALVASSYSLYRFLNSDFSTARFTEYGVKGEGGNVLSTYMSSLMTMGYRTVATAVCMFIGTELAAACLIYLVYRSIRYKDHLRQTAFFGLSALFLLAQALCLGTDYVWHGGSRIMFPFRNAYMVSLLACLMIAYCLTETPLFSALKEKKQRKLSPLCLGAFFLLCAGAVLFAVKVYQPQILHFSVLTILEEPRRFCIPFAVCFGLLTLALLALTAFHNAAVKRVLALLTVFAVIGANAWHFIGNAEGSSRAWGYDVLVKTPADIAPLTSNTDALSRTSNPDLSLLTNYPFFADASAMSAWINNIGGERKTAYTSLGFSDVYTRLADSGGTAFSKAFLRETESIARAELNPALYEKTEDTASGFTRYRNRFVLPAAVVCNAAVAEINPADYADTFAYQNAVFSALGGNGVLFSEALPQHFTQETADASEYAKKNNVPLHEALPLTVWKATLRTAPDSTLYCCLRDDTAALCCLRVNGKNVPVYRNAEQFDSVPNTAYPQDYNNGVLELGSYDGETVEIEMALYSGGADCLQFSLMDNARLAALCSSLPSCAYSCEKDTLTLKLSAETDGVALVPVFYQNWRCTVNGNAATPQQVLGDFTAVPVTGGENTVTLSYPHTGGWFAFLMEFAAFGIAAALIFLEKRLRLPERLLSVLQGVYGVLCGGCIVLLYVIPLSAHLFLKIFR